MKINVNLCLVLGVVVICSILNCLMFINKHVKILLVYLVM